MTVLDLRGRLTVDPATSAGSRLHRIVCNLVNAGCLDLVINLYEVTDIDARGLGALAAIMQTVCAAGGKVTLAGASARVARMLSITRLDAATQWCEAAVPA